MKATYHQPGVFPDFSFVKFLHTLD